MSLDPLACYQAVLARDARYDGKFFTCVRTTRIYCRPICPTHPPKLVNCTFVRTAAAAHEAGYRPCLRCRPESSPDLGAWLGTSAVVSKAMRLIEAGALDTGDVPALAARVGLGDRHLRRLFLRHLGASPLTVAQTRRVLLAKQLLYETTLSITEVALASGFGSVRRFNETFRQLFRRSPAEFRRAASDASPPGSGIRLLLPYRAPYDWSAMIGFLGQRSIAGVECVSADRYRRVISVDGKPGLLSVSHQPGKNALLVELHVSDLAALPGILARVRRLFDLSADPIAIDAALSGDSNLAALVRKRPGMRVPGAWDEREIFLWAILEAENSLSAAASTIAHLAETLGTPFEGGVDLQPLRRSFPSASDLEDAATTSGHPLRGNSELLAAAVTALRQQPGPLASRRCLVQSIGRLVGNEARRHWAAQYVAMRALREVEAFPLARSDIPIWLRASGPFPRPAAIEPRKEWRPWHAYAAMHFWAAAQPDAATPSAPLREVA